MILVVYEGKPLTVQEFIMGSLILGLALVAVSIALFLIVSRVTRKNESAPLFNDMWVANFHVPLMVGLFAFGCGFLTKFVLVTFV